MNMKYVNTVEKTMKHCDEYEICEHSWKNNEALWWLWNMWTQLKKEALWWIWTQLKKNKHCDDYEICEHSWKKNEALWWIWNMWTQLKKKEAYDILYTVMIIIMLDVLNGSH